MHRDPVSRAIEGREQSNNFVFRIFLEKMQAPGTIFAAAPGKQGAFHVGMELVV
jgi:hypothetical protein